MKKSLLLLSLAFAGTAFSASAASEVYVFDYLGLVGNVSDNGKYAAIYDDEDGYAYLWRVDDPEMLYDISEISEEGLPNSMTAKSTTVMDVSDDGVAVGSVLFKDGHQHPAVYKDGKWEMLPIEPEAINTNEAVCITPDGKVIAGYQYMKLEPREGDGGITGKFVPCQWFLQEDGTYELKTYSDGNLLDHQGFFPLTQTPDGKVIGGTIYAGFGSNLNAIVKEGELVIFDEVSALRVPALEYGGKYWTGNIYDENGKFVKQTWTEDINDPNVIWDVTTTIDGYRDGLHGESGLLNGFFTNCDEYGNLYGTRTYVNDVTEEHDAKLTSNAVIYNYLDDTWYDEQGVSFFSAGIKDELLYTGDGEVIMGNEVKTVREAYDIQTRYNISGIDKISANGNVLGGVSYEIHPATGEPLYYPFMVIVDPSIVGVESVLGSPKKGLVIVSAGRIEVMNAESAAVYDLKGALLSTEMVTEVPAGIYVVKAGDASYKVVVK